MRRRHLLTLGLYAGLVGFWSLPLLVDFETTLPGRGAGDNLSFVWNLWWMKQALADPATTFFFCSKLFYPFGVDLTLHTHTALPALVAATLGRNSSVIAAQNVIVLAHLFLNLSVAYALAFHITRHATASMLAGFIFGCSPYICGHLPGHFNLLAAWTLPLAALLAARMFDRPTPGSRLLLGVTLGGIAYLDYYYFIYAVLIVLLIPLIDSWRPERRTHRTRSRWHRYAVTAIIAFLMTDVVVIAIILTTGGTVLRIGRISVSMMTLANPSTLAGVLLMIWVAIEASSRWRARIDASGLVRLLLVLRVPLIAGVLLILPLIAHAYLLWQRGDYVTQAYVWRSAPSGIDAASLLLGNPFNAFWGPVARSAYDFLRIDAIERVAWLGPGAMALAVIAIASGRDRASVRRWSAIGCIFLVWALGPYLMVAGRNTFLMLPATLIRWVPIVNNARIPARAIVVTYLAVAVLAAIAYARLTSADRRPGKLAAGLFALAVIDLLPARPPIFSPERPAVYEAIRASRVPGAVLELPLGIRDGFGEIGRLDPNVLFYQTLHGRPIVGGFVARLPPSIVDRYQRIPVFRDLLRLSAGLALPDQRALPLPGTAKSLSDMGIRYVVLNNRLSPSALVAYVHALTPLQVFAKDDERIVYLTGAPPPPSPAR